MSLTPPPGVPRFSVAGDTLTVAGVDYGDQGRFRCRAWTPLDAAEAEAELRVVGETLKNGGGDPNKWGRRPENWGRSPKNEEGTPKNGEETRKIGRASKKLGRGPQKWVFPLRFSRHFPPVFPVIFPITFPLSPRSPQAARAPCGTCRLRSWASARSGSAGPRARSTTAPWRVRGALGAVWDGNLGRFGESGGSRGVPGRSGSIRREFWSSGFGGFGDFGIWEFQDLEFGSFGDLGI